ncbi:MAG: class I SAM-dependent methyltransferase [Victivallaceae bacterium]|nr:class I SAM-dependent methyltransferase [Victivallaceae bacterium]
MKNILCPVCGADNRDVFIRGNDLLHDIPGEFTLSKCACGMIYINPQPDNNELQKYYPDDYCPHRKRHSDRSLKKHRKFKSFILRWYYGCPVNNKRISPKLLRILFKPILFFLSLSTMKSMIPYHGNGDILDVGCGNGGWLIRLKEAGWNTSGVEIDQPAAQDANDIGIPTFCGTLIDAHFPDESFDVIRLHYVFEHLIDPKETLDEIRRILKPDGICYIRIPNIDSIAFSLFKEYWFALDIPRHVFNYTPKTFTQLASGHGLRVTRIHFNSPHTGFLTSLEYMRKKGSLPAVLRKIKDNSFWKNLWRPIGWLVC